MSSSQLTHIFQRGRAQPPTRNKKGTGTPHRSAALSDAKGISNVPVVKRCSLEAVCLVQILEEALWHCCGLYPFGVLRVQDLIIRANSFVCFCFGLFLKSVFLLCSLGSFPRIIPRVHFPGELACLGARIEMQVAETGGLICKDIR